MLPSHKAMAPPKIMLSSWTETPPLHAHAGEDANNSVNTTSVLSGVFCFMMLQPTSPWIDFTTVSPWTGALMMIAITMVRALGIDLGTTYSLAATVREKVPKVLRDDNGEGRLPSVVFYAADLDDGALVGFEALQAARELRAGALLTSTKRFMGKGRADAVAALQSGARNFALWDGEGQATRFVEFAVPDGANAMRPTTPIEVAAYVLKTLKDRAEQEFGEEVSKAVITVPAYFDEAQRQATRDAARLAGLEPLRLLTEPTAAAIAYGLDAEAAHRGQGTYAVFDLGGGTFDVSVLTFDAGLFRVLSTAGDTALGGDDFDWPLAKRVLEAAGLGDNASPAQVQQAMAMARQAKESLTDHTSVNVQGVLLVDGVAVDVSFTVTRDEFDAIILPVVNRCADPCERALRDAGLTPDKLDGVVLVGGSTRVPLVRSFVRTFFGREPLLDAHPDEVVALGAALQADLLTGGESDLLLLDVTPLSLGVETMGGVIDKLITRNATIPCSATHTFTTYVDGQTAMDFHVVQGEREKVEHCRSLARFRLRGIPPLGAGLARVVVTFQLDADGLLMVHAKEQATGVSQSVEVKPSYGLTDDEVEQMLMSSIDHADADIEERLLIEKRVEARRVISATHKALEADGPLLQGDEAQRIHAAIVALEDALQSPNRRAIEADLEALDSVTQPFAQRRMTQKIGEALESRNIDSL
jgi:molecular chaperone HscA